MYAYVCIYIGLTQPRVNPNLEGKHHEALAVLLKKGHE